MNFIDQKTINEIEVLTKKYGFFHWFLEFPDVFERNERGFDCILGNPPWENVQPEEKQFFNSCRPDVAAVDGEKRKKLIESLKNQEPNTYALWQRHVRDINLLVKYIKSSGAYPFQGRGKLISMAFLLNFPRT